MTTQNHFNSHRIKAGASKTAPNNTAHMNVHCCWQSWVTTFWTHLACINV